jgi:hypothetical protein
MDVDLVWRETNEYGSAGEYVHDSETAIITNRNTGYRWILRRRRPQVEFRTPEMLEKSVADQGIQLHLTVEEAEALANAIAPTNGSRDRERCLVEQALDQVALVCRRVRERVRLGDETIDVWTSSIPRQAAECETFVPVEEAASEPRPRARSGPFGDPDDLSLAQAAEVLGKARNTIYRWYRRGTFPPAVDASNWLQGSRKPLIVVPRYRLDAWLAGDRMPGVFAATFEPHALRVPPWVCWTIRRDALREDVDFWIERRQLLRAMAGDDQVIYGREIVAERIYDLGECVHNPVVLR